MNKLSDPGPRLHTRPVQGTLQRPPRIQARKLHWWCQNEEENFTDTPKTCQAPSGTVQAGFLHPHGDPLRKLIASPFY